MTNNFFASETFKALLTAIEQQYGPIESFTVCNHSEIPEISDQGDNTEELIIDEYPEIPEDSSPSLVWCCLCNQQYPETACLSSDERVGPDMIPYQQWICQECEEDIESGVTL